MYVEVGTSPLGRDHYYEHWVTYCAHLDLSTLQTSEMSPCVVWTNLKKELQNGSRGKPSCLCEETEFLIAFLFCFIRALPASWGTVMAWLLTACMEISVLPSSFLPQGLEQCLFFGM